VTAANLGVFAFLGQVYGIEVVGLFASYLAFVILFGSLVGAGLPDMLMRRVSMTTALTARSLRALRTPYWLAALILIGVSGLPGYGALRLLEDQLGIDLPAAAAFGPGVYVFGMLVSEELRGRGHAEAALFFINFGTIVAPLASLLAAFAFAGRGAPILATLVWAQVLASFALGVTYAVIAGVRIDRASSCVRVWRTLSRRDLASMAFMRVFSAGATHITVLIVGAVGTPALAGFVAVSTRLAGLAATYTGIINASFARRIGAAFRDKAKSWRLFLQTSALSTLGVGALMGPIILLPQLFLGVFGVDGRIAGTAVGLQLLAGSRVLRAMAGVSDLFLLVSGRAYLELIATLAGFASLLCGMILLPATPVGVAVALAASTLIQGTLSASFTLRLQKL